MSVIESFAYSVGVSLIICTLRLIGLKFQLINIPNATKTWQDTI